MVINIPTLLIVRFGRFNMYSLRHVNFTNMFVKLSQYILFFPYTYQFCYRNISVREMLKIICNWDDDIYYLRNNLFEAINLLYENAVANDSKITISKKLVMKAMDCHLRPQKNSKKSDVCPICIANRKLKAYEGKLFSIRDRGKLFEEMSLRGSWKPTKEELIFKSEYIIFS